jgi:hypothetical protein
MFVGRVVCDSEGKLNPDSCLLEGTLLHSQGRSIKLKLDGLPSYRLFPGQASAVMHLPPTRRPSVPHP